MRSVTEPMSEVEIDLQTQLSCALKIMTQTQVDTWELQMQLLQKECELMDARRAILDRDHTIQRLREDADGPFIKR